LKQERISRRKNLTDRYIETLKPPNAGRLDVTDTKVRGLVLRLTAASTRHAKGLKIWAVRYRPKGGGQLRETIGEYGKEPGISLAKARARALEVIAAAAGGKDLPAEQAQQRRRDAARVRTLGELINEYVAVYCKVHQRRWKQTEKLLNAHIKPHLGNRRLVELKRHDGAELMDKLEKAGLRAQVNRARSALVHALNWAVERGYLDANPLANLRRRKNLESERGRVLSDTELRAIWRAAHSLADPSRAFVKVIILLGQRRDEVRCLPWKERLPGTDDWLIMGKRNKGKRDHLVPFSPAVTEIVDALPRRGPYVFTVSGERPYAGQKRLLDILRRKSGVVDWHYHDLRRTMASGMAKLGISQDVIDRVLNHAKSRLAKVYNVYEYRDEKATALKKWADRVAIVVNNGLQAPNVTELRTA
jgi:integrase